MVVYFYYTTEEQEAALQEKYEALVAEKQAELDAKGVLQKYTARAYIHERVRVFHVRGDVAYFGSVCDENKMVTCANAGANAGGAIYALDADFKDRIETFLNGETTYSVTFSPSGKYGPTLDYCGRSHEMPAVITTESGNKLSVEDENKYDIGCL